ncbi:MAG: cysteine hydrolase [Planctomycetota bacterium]
MPESVGLSRRDVLRTTGMAAATVIPGVAQAQASESPERSINPRSRPAAALVVIDPYNDFISEGGKRWESIKPVAERLNTVPNMLKLMHAARSTGVWVFYSLHHRPKPGDYDGWLHPNPSHAAVRDAELFAHGSWGGTIRDEFTPQPGDVVCQEHWTTGGFNTTDMDFLLKARGIERLVLCGLLSGSCVEMTGRHAVELGYHVTMVTDAVADGNEAAHRAAVELNYPRFAHAVTDTGGAIRTFGQG